MCSKPDYENNPEPKFEINNQSILIPINIKYYSLASNY